ncbi:phage tail protein [Burkholderia territorii]|uniref:phage tail protein n=1 Tax=Burkholderia territorii TaxID=1503055 RepID=UPI000757DB10|nr:phage tail protein [Burkholderia territorii]KVG59219.1 oxidoreductase [Burkholderia territorii]
MDVIRQITGAATQAGIATERVRQMVRIFDRNRAASMSTVDMLQRLATGNLSSAAELLTGASGAIPLASDLFPQVGTVLRSFNAAQASVGAILTAIDGSSFPLVRVAADSVKSALGGAWNQFNASVGLKDSAVMTVITSTGIGSMVSGLFDGATSSTPHLMSMTTDAGDAFHFNLSTAAYDKLRRATRYRVAPQERLNRQEALQAVSEGGETITLSGVVFPALGSGTKQINRLREIGGRMKPVQLTTGDGDVLGRWLLQSIEEEQDALLVDGMPRKQTFSVEFGRYGEDFKNV